MVRILLTIISSVLPGIILAQDDIVHVAVASNVDTSRQAIASVVRVWEQYLDSRPDSVRPNPYWVQSEQQEYMPFDLAGYTWWNPCAYWGLRRWKITVLSVTESDSAYVIRTMFSARDRRDSCQYNPLSIIQTGARLEDGSYKLCNVLSINTRHWHKEQVGSIKFVFPQDHIFNCALAERMSRFVDSLAALWQLPVVNTAYYFADNLDCVAKALGFDYWPAEGNISGVRGFTDFRNRIVYAGGSDEWYPHEFVHIYLMPLFPNAHYFFHEGYATLLGGSQGHDLLWHIRRNNEYLKNHPDIDVLSFKGVDPFVGPSYFVGGLICKMVDEKGGVSAIRKLMTYGPANEDLYRACNDFFGVSKEGVNGFLREKLAEYAAR
jgi:hypothetical protein